MMVHGGTSEADAHQEGSDADETAPENSPQQASPADSDPHPDDRKAQVSTPPGTREDRQQIGPELELSEGAALLFLGFCGDMTEGKLADLSGRGIGIVTHTLARLDAMGLAEKKPTQIATFYGITPAGHKWLQEKSIVR